MTRRPLPTLADLMHDRRHFVIATTVALSGEVPSRALAQLAAARRVGVLAPSTPATEEIVLKPFFDHMVERGWEEGKSIVYDRVFADDQQQRLVPLAVELVSRKPDVIYAPPTPAAIAAKMATDTIPIVFGAVWDPVGSGLVSSLAHPSGNVTGVSVFSESLGPKRLQLLQEILPNVKRFGCLADSTDPTTKSDRRSLEPFAASNGITIVEAEGANPREVEVAIGHLIAQRVDVIYTGTSPLLYNLRGRLIEIASREHVPVIAYRSQLADAGALLSYGTSLRDQIRRSAAYVDKILRGATPASLPVEQATVFELVVNTRAAKLLGIVVPRSILLRADRVIE
jgi:putative tryptophan/tyrosine transport system substrate-binding protein